MSQTVFRVRPGRTPDTHSFVAHGDTLFQAGHAGSCWRICRGAVRLSRGNTLEVGDEQFAGIARAGEIIGVETLLGQPHRFTAHALADCEVERCARLDKDVLMASLIASEQRAADALSLRIGTAESRLQHLMRLLAQPDASGYAHIEMPSLREMSEMTDLSRETISRHISRLGQIGHLVRRNRNNAFAAPQYLHPASSASLSLAA